MLPQAAGSPHRSFRQLQCGQGDSVHAQGYIKAVIGTFCAEMKLAGDSEDIASIPRFKFRVEPMGGLKKRNSQRLAVAFESMAQGGQHSVDIHPLAERGNHPFSGLFLVQGFQLLPCFRLRFADKPQRCRGKDR